MDILPDQSYDDITDLAALICETSTALVSLIDDGQHWIKSKHNIDADQATQAIHFCEQTVARPNELFVVRDAHQYEQFADTPLAIDGSQIRFYAGAALVSSEGDTLGTLCVIDQVPRQLTEDQQDALWALSRQVVAQVELTNARIKTLNVIDDLTGLHNGLVFEEELRNEVHRAWESDSPLSLLLLDADHFKSYNDEFGHPAGDDALKTIAGYLKGSTRPTDFVARIGGEEFVIILPKTPQESAWVMAERWRKVLELAVWHERPITVSIGISSLDGRNIDTRTLISEADLALFHSKATGRNRVSHANDLTV